MAQQWYITSSGDTAIRCDPRKLEDTLAQMFRGDWQRAKKLVKKLHPATLTERVKYELE